MHTFFNDYLILQVLGLTLIILFLLSYLSINILFIGILFVWISIVWLFLYDLIESGFLLFFIELHVLLLLFCIIRVWERFESEELAVIYTTRLNIFLRFIVGFIIIFLIYWLNFTEFSMLNNTADSFLIFHIIDQGCLESHSHFSNFNYFSILWECLFITYSYELTLINLLITVALLLYGIFSLAIYLINFLRKFFNFNNYTLFKKICFNFFKRKQNYNKQWRRSCSTRIYTKNNKKDVTKSK